MDRDSRWEDVYATIQKETFGYEEVVMFRISLRVKDRVYYTTFAADPKELSRFGEYRAILDKMVRQMDDYLLQL